MSGNYRKEKNCLNCGHHVEEHYCSHCGQPNLELKEPFWGFIGHSIGHYFHFDSKFFHTLIPLMTKPGQITLDYLAGKRARYIHPVSLYIFVSIVYFITIHALEEKPVHKFVPTQEQVDKSKKADSLLAAVEAQQDNELGKYLTKVAHSELNIIRTTLDFKKLSEVAQLSYLDSLKKINTAHPNPALTKRIESFEEIVSDKRDSTSAAYTKHQQTLPVKGRDSWFKRGAKKTAYYLKERKQGDEDELDEEVKKYAPKQYFLLMPLLAFFIMLNFRKNKIYYIDHLVFTVHGMTAFFIITIISEPIKKYIFGEDSTMSNILGFLVIVGIFWYMYKGLKLFYGRSVRLTIRKTITVSLLYAIAFGISGWVIEELILHIIH